MFNQEPVTTHLIMVQYARYDREENCFRTLLDIQFVAAMGPPGGGRNHVTPRYLRHFVLLYIIDFDDSTLGTVFETIVDWWVRSCRLSNDVSQTKADM